MFAMDASDSTISALYIEGAGVKTAEGVGVGADVRTLKRTYGSLCHGAGATGEDVWFATLPLARFTTTGRAARTPADTDRVTGIVLRKGLPPCRSA